MVTVVTEGIFSYCGVKVKIDTDRHLGPERARWSGRSGEPIGHVSTGEYGSQMLSLGGVQHLTGGSKKEGRVDVRRDACTVQRRRGGARYRRRRHHHGAGRACAGGRTGRWSSECGWAAARPRSACSPSSGRAGSTRSSWWTTTSPACCRSTRQASCWASRKQASASTAGKLDARPLLPGGANRVPAGAGPISPIRSPSSAPFNPKRRPALA